jgi:bifunctional ADP-heptose synthase (sugar kinase/adenylyltransferase)
LYVDDGMHQSILFKYFGCFINGVWWVVCLRGHVFLLTYAEDVKNISTVKVKSLSSIRRLKDQYALHFELKCLTR